VLEDVQQGCDVGLHTRREEVHDHVVAPELGDGEDQLLPHLLADLDHPQLDRSGHTRQQVIDGGDDDVHGTMLVSRAGPEPDPESHVGRGLPRWR
jgi:hypothetical protein